MAYNLGNFMRTLALPKEVEHWSLTTLREKLVKIGAKVVRHGPAQNMAQFVLAMSLALAIGASSDRESQNFAAPTERP